MKTFKEFLLEFIQRPESFYVSQIIKGNLNRYGIKDSSIVTEIAPKHYHIKIDPRYAYKLKSLAASIEKDSKKENWNSKVSFGI